MKASAPRDVRIVALRRFAVAITALTILGHGFLGFEQSVLHVFVALATAYAVEVLLEWVHARARRRPSALSGGPRALIDFLLPAHITGLAIAMLLYPNERVLPMVFAVATAIASKSIFRITIGERSRHFLNPSNTGMAVTLLLFPWVGMVPPYHFTENTTGFLDGAIPAIVIITGTLLNAFLTRRVPLILAWLAGFATQAVVRSVIFGTPLVAGLLPMTGMAFLLFTFYMIPDPGTTPLRTRSQILFGAGTAAVYGILMTLHIVFGLFFSLFIVCILRGLGLSLLSLRTSLTARPAVEGARP